MCCNCNLLTVRWPLGPSLASLTQGKPHRRTFAGSSEAGRRIPRLRGGGGATAPSCKDACLLPGPSTVPSRPPSRRSASFAQPAPRSKVRPTPQHGLVRQLQPRLACASEQPSCRFVPRFPRACSCSQRRSPPVVHRSVPRATPTPSPPRPEEHPRRARARVAEAPRAARAAEPQSRAREARPRPAPPPTRQVAHSEALRAEVEATRVEPAAARPRPRPLIPTAGTHFPR
jgi:hypothetical protein